MLSCTFIIWMTIFFRCTHDGPESQRPQLCNARKFIVPGPSQITLSFGKTRVNTILK